MVVRAEDRQSVNELVLGQLVDRAAVDNFFNFASIRY